MHKHAGSVVINAFKLAFLASVAEWNSLIYKCEAAFGYINKFNVRFHRLHSHLLKKPCVPATGLSPDVQFIDFTCCVGEITVKRFFFVFFALLSSFYLQDIFWTIFRHNSLEEKDLILFFFHIPQRRFTNKLPAVSFPLNSSYFSDARLLITLKD